MDRMRITCADAQQKGNGISMEMRVGSSHHLNEVMALPKPPRNLDHLCGRQEMGTNFRIE